VTGTRGTRPYALSWVALDKHVLIVEVKSGDINHGAFIGAVKGEDYGAEALDVAANGSAAWSRLADIYFKGFGSGPVKPLRVYEPFFEDKPSKTDHRLLDPSIIEVRPVDEHVLLVALRARGNTWKAFISGKRRGFRFGSARRDQKGTPVPYELAEVCFEDLARGERWHKKLRVFIDDEDYGPAEDWGDEKPARPEMS